MTSLEGHHANDSAFRNCRTSRLSRERSIRRFAWLDRAALQRDSNCMYVRSMPSRQNRLSGFSPPRQQSRSTGRRRTRSLSPENSIRDRGTDQHDTEFADAARVLVTRHDVNLDLRGCVMRSTG